MAVNWRGDEAIRRIRTGGARGLTRAARALLAESQTRVPWDSGDLSRSGTVHEASPAELEAAVTYSATSPDGFNYGVAVHEGLHMNFRADHNPGASAKFLERPAIELESKLMAVVATEIRREVG
ncbi:hypothetical protein PTQ19_10390 [Microbacterium esteraromaticum]|uniref:hypothetical protein n=1 Tax=Microbacterium esteraromaticum TaxID=57043 RepID=UPI002368DDD6|nr:hypothetical protein [Microbacterium esteraromaticum]WDH77930.1 hypothetical protein PTQ19_10390 [Microbacterium esteraromaticum]